MGFSLDLVIGASLKLRIWLVQDSKYRTIVDGAGV